MSKMMYSYEQICDLIAKGFTPKQIVEMSGNQTESDEAPTTEKKSKTSSKPVSKSKTSTEKKSKTSSASSSSSKKKVEVPKLTADQLLNWSYYKKVRTNYCYAVMGCKVWKGKVTKPEGFVFDQKKWDKARADFEKVNKYVKKADR